MSEYRVGKLYFPGKHRWVDGTDFNYRSGCLELRMFFSNLTPQDIREIRSGPCSFHLAVVNDTLFILFQFGKACPLSDNSYSWHMVAEDERTIPPMLSSDERATITIILVSSEDGIIRAIRQIALSHDFSVALYQAIREQIDKPFDRQEHDRNIAATYAQYPTPQSLLRKATATCIIKGKEGQN